MSQEMGWRSWEARSQRYWRSGLCEHWSLFCCISALTLGTCRVWAAFSVMLFIYIQVERKRHIGNDIVTIVFQEGEEPSPAFKPSMIRSHFTRILGLCEPSQGLASLDLKWPSSLMLRWTGTCWLFWLLDPKSHSLCPLQWWMDLFILREFFTSELSSLSSSVYEMRGTSYPPLIIRELEEL